jgi:integrase
MKADDASRLRPRTQKLYLGYWNNHLEPPVGKKALTRVSAANVTTMLTRIPGNARAKRVHELTKRLFGYAVDHKWMAENPALKWKRRHEARRQSYLDAATLTRLLEALPVNEVGEALRFAALSDARIGEVLSLGWSDLRDEGTTWLKSAWTTKQKKAHVVPLPLAAVAIIERQLRVRAQCLLAATAQNIKKIALALNPSRFPPWLSPTPSCQIVLTTANPRAVTTN